MELIYKSRFFATYQCDRRRCFFLDLGLRQIKLSCCQLLALRQKLKSVDLDAHFNGLNPSGIEIISICNRDHLLILNTLEVAELKEVIKATFGFLEIHSLLRV